MLVGLLVWAYANGVSSSRRIEQLCVTDVAFRLICAGNRPDHATVARFRAAFAGAVPVFFAQVLALCARLGMGKLGTVALDGMKIAASASAAANRTEARLARLAAEIAARHAQTDAAEDELFGDARGDEVPEDVWRPGSRDERIAAALASLHAERAAAEHERAAKAEAFRQRQAAGQRTGPHPVPAAVALAQENLARVKAARAAQLAELAERRAAGAPRRHQAGIDDHCRVRAAAAKVEAAQARAAAAERAAAEKEANRKGPGPVRNLTDPDSRLMRAPRGGGYLQGYNAQNVTSADGLIIATKLTSDPVDYTWFTPMMRAAEHAAALIRTSRPAPAHSPADRIGLILADAGYCSEANLTTPGPDRLIATGTQRDLEHAARNGASRGRQRTGPATMAMAARLTTEAGLAAYRQRGHIAETPHGLIKHNRRFRQLSLRGADQSQRRMGLHRRHPQPGQSHHQRPPHHQHPGHPAHLTPTPSQAATRQPAPTPPTASTLAGDSATAPRLSASSHRRRRGSGRAGCRPRAWRRRPRPVRLSG